MALGNVRKDYKVSEDQNKGRGVNDIFFMKVDIQVFCVPKNALSFYAGWGLWKAISYNNSNKTTLHMQGTLQLQYAFIYVIQIIQGASCGMGARGLEEDVFKGRSIVSVL